MHAHGVYPVIFLSRTYCSLGSFEGKQLSQRPLGSTVSGWSLCIESQCIQEQPCTHCLPFVSVLIYTVYSMLADANNGSNKTLLGIKCTFQDFHAANRSTEQLFQQISSQDENNRTTYSTSRRALVRN